MSLSYQTVLKILLPAILCGVIIGLTEFDQMIYPIIFGIIIGVGNWRKVNNHFLYFLYGCIGSYISFLIAYLSLFLLWSLKHILGEEVASLIGLIIAPNVIAPVLIFILYKFIYGFEETKFTRVLIIGSISLLTLISSYYLLFNNNSEMEVNGTSNLFLNWQVIMALTIQMIIYQEELYIKN